MKSWADHCSSDEESDLEDRVSKLKVELEPEPPLQEEQENEAAHVQNEGPESPLEEAGKTGTGPPDNHQQQHHHHHHQQRPRTYDFPELPPYTAFVGNLAYSVRDSSDLANAIVDLVHDRLGRTIVVKDARIAYGNDRDRNEKKHRGFGYVEVETLEDLKLMMELNETGATLSGRKIQLDTANHKNKRNSNNNNNIPSGAAPEIDGRHFRGGRYSNQGGGAPGGGGRRNSHSNSNNRRSSGGGGGRGGHHHHNHHHHNGSHDNAEPKQRPSLKLQPRTKPVEKDSHQQQPTNAANNSRLGLEDQSSGSAQNIFGRGKARDESSWKDRPPKKSHDEDQQSSQRRRSGNTTGGRGGNTGGRGGRGGRGGGGGGGRHHHHSRHSANSNNSNNQGGGRRDSKNSSAQREEKKKPNVTQQNTETQKHAPPKKPVSNKFALLQFDSDSD